MESMREGEKQFINQEESGKNKEKLLEDFSNDDQFFKENVDNKILNAENKQKIEEEDKDKLSEIKKQLGIEEEVENSDVENLKDFEKKYQKKIEDLKKKEENYKMEELKTVTYLANEYIKEYTDKLGVDSFDFSSDNIDWLKYSKDNEKIGGLYHDEDRKIEIKKGTRAPMAEVIIHELIHFQSSLKNKENIENIPNRTSKVGFHSNWFSQKENLENEKDIFRGLNESITDKIAKEIYAQKKDSLLSDIQITNPDLVKENKTIIEEIKNTELEKINFMERLGEKKWLEYIKNKNEPGDINYELDSYEINGGFEEFKQDYKNSILKDFEKKDKKNLGQDYVLGSSEEVGYNQEIRALDIILDRLAYGSSQEQGISLDEAKEKEWDELQKAFFEGNTLYLKKIDRVVGKGTLRELNKLNRLNLSNKENINDRVNEFIKKIEK